MIREKKLEQEQKGQADQGDMDPALPCSPRRDAAQPALHFAPR
jgi:hypothetical protein